MKNAQRFWKKSFWLTKESAARIRVEAKKQKISESALMRDIINSSFKNEK